MTTPFKKSEIASELTDLGYQTDKQRRGLVKWINSVLSVLLFISVSANFVQWRTQMAREDQHAKQVNDLHDKMDNLNSKYNDIFLQMLNIQRRTEEKMDTVKAVVDKAIK